MPLKFQIQKYFEKDDLLQRTLDYLENLKSNTITNFVQGKLWKKKKRF